MDRSTHLFGLVWYELACFGLVLGPYKPYLIISAAIRLWNRARCVNLNCWQDLFVRLTHKLVICLFVWKQSRILLTPLVQLKHHNESFYSFVSYYSCKLVLYLCLIPPIFGYFFGNPGF